MIAAYFKYQFAGLWELLWYFGLGGVIIAACVALYVFTPAFMQRIFPNIQKTLIWVAACTLAVMITLGIGVNLGEKRVRAQCDAEKQIAIKNAQDARARAQRTLARKPSRWLPNNSRPDPDCRDCSNR